MMVYLSFKDIPTIDGITGAKICLAAGYTIKPGKLYANTSTLNGGIDASTTTVLLASATQFTGVATGQYEPTSTNPVGNTNMGSFNRYRNFKLYGNEWK